MTADPQVAEFFRSQFEDASNCLCCDSGRVEPFWASISYGIYISIEAAGIHRSLGVKVSRVQSITMDSWKPIHMKMMQLGGNRKFNDFLAEHGIPEDTPIREKYNTRAAEWYRNNLSALAEGLQPLAPLETGTGHLPVHSCPSPEQKKLDEVFASTTSTSATAAAVVEVQRKHHVSTRTRTLCERVCDCFKVQRQGKTDDESYKDFPSSEDDSSGSDADLLLPDKCILNFLSAFSSNSKL